MLKDASKQDIYSTQNNNFFRLKSSSVTPKLNTENAQLYEKLKTINYSIGSPLNRITEDKPVDYPSPEKSDGPHPGRFNDEEVFNQTNFNLIKTMKLGDNIVSLKGEDDPVAVRQREATTYTRVT